MMAFAYFDISALFKASSIGYIVVYSLSKTVYTFNMILPSLSKSSKHLTIL
jgi:hypothetical protein